MEPIKNKHEGKRVFIVGGGPSLDRTNLSLLENEYSIAANNINDIFSRTSWRPYYYINTQNHADPRDINIASNHANTSFVNKKYKSKINSIGNIRFLNCRRISEKKHNCLGNPHPKDKRNKWSDNIYSHVYWYNNSIYPMYQLANFLGFRTIYLVGCDLGMDNANYVVYEDYCLDPVVHARKEGGVSVKSTITFLLRSKSKSKAVINALKTLYIYIGSGLFRERYARSANFEGYSVISKLFNRGADDKIRRAHSLAKRKLESRGVTVYNATKGGELEMFERYTLEEVLRN